MKLGRLVSMSSVFSRATAAGGAIAAKVMLKEQINVNLIAFYGSYFAVEWLSFRKKSEDLDYFLRFNGKR
ncbi:MAG: hypothetical protein P4L53_14115 [Candidatus Obscuribacterales bacterium]|nr:hypothetical protein [Candidatus Obscuribacterales bacterium]